MTIPYIGFGNDTLKKLPIVHMGDKIICDRCGKKHELKGGTMNGKPSEMILFYVCGRSSYLGALNNRLVDRLKPDISGDI